MKSLGTVIELKLIWTKTSFVRQSPTAEKVGANVGGQAGNGSDRQG